MSTAYSGTALAKKLGIKKGHVFKVMNEPDYYFHLFSDFPDSVEATRDQKGKKDIIHYFATNEKKFERDMSGLKEEMKQNGGLWVSWYKKTSGMEIRVNDKMVRTAGRKLGLIDVKVCAVNQYWSAMKFVIPIAKRLRQ